MTDENKEDHYDEWKEDNWYATHDACWEEEDEEDSEEDDEYL